MRRGPVGAKTFSEGDRNTTAAPIGAAGSIILVAARSPTRLSIRNFTRLIIVRANVSRVSPRRCDNRLVGTRPTVIYPVRYRTD